VLNYLVEKYDKRISYFKIWHEVKEAVRQIDLPFAYQQQAVKDVVETFNAWREAGGRRPEVRRVAPYVDERAWRLYGVATLSLRLIDARVTAELCPHRRFWRFEVRMGKAKRASTIRLRRDRDRVYAVFTYEVEPEAERKPLAITAFDVNENTVVVAARIDLKQTVEKVAEWNRDKIQPPTSIRVFKTDFGRLARRYAAIRRRWAEELSLKINGKKLSGVHTREFRKCAQRLREGRRKRDRVNKIAHELTKEHAISVTEDVGKRPQGRW